MLICLPFDLEVLIAKMGALLRRSSIANNIISSLIKIGELELDTEKLMLRSHNSQVILSRNEFKLIKKLMEKPGKVKRIIIRASVK